MMRIILTYLFDRIFHCRSRADELFTLRKRFATAKSTKKVDKEIRAKAEELRQLREAFIEMMGEVKACAKCARNRPLSFGPWEGGFCCSGKTEHLFSDDEIAALLASKTRPQDLKAPRSGHYGCIFRGPKGCHLPAKHRPNICVIYICDALGKELVARKDHIPLRDIALQLKDEFAQFLILISNTDDDDDFDLF